MELKNYETVFILNPVLSEAQIKDTVEKFKTLMKNQKAEVVNEEAWGLKNLAYPIKKKNSGLYFMIEFNATPTFIKVLETEFTRDENVLRFLTTVLDKHAVEYNNRRRKGEFRKKKEKAAEA